MYTYGDFSIKNILPGIGITLEAEGPITSMTTSHLPPDSGRSREARLISSA